MRVVIALLLSVAAAQAAAETKFYQCKDKWGQPVFSERPCGADATAGSVEAPQASGSVDSSDFGAVTASNSIRDDEREIERLEEDVERLERVRDAKLKKLEQRTHQASNNLAGAQYHESLATEMQAVTAQYQSKIDGVNGKIQRLHDQIEKAGETR